MTQLRILTYNVQSLRRSPDGVARVIRACAPDIVCLQEVPRFLFAPTRLARLAADSEQHVAVHQRRTGLAVLARWGIAPEAATTMLLPSRPGRHQRGLAVSSLRVGTARFAIATVHFGLDAAERQGQALLIVAELARTGLPVVVAGDINEEPGAPAFDLLATHYTDAHSDVGQGRGATFVSWSPERRIDALFVDPRLTVLDCAVVEHPEASTASDHRPVVATLAW